MKTLRYLTLGMLVLGLAGCETVNDWFAEAKPDPLPGKRMSVVELQTRLDPDPALAAITVTADAAQDIQDWPFAGGPANHDSGNRHLGDSLKKIWSIDIGSASDGRARLIAQPVIQNDRIYTMDASGTVRAFDSHGGKNLWSTDTTPEYEQSGALTGGLGVDGNRLFVTTGYASVVALDTGSGSILWQKKLTVPSRAAPVVADGKVLVQTIDNQTLALSAEDGNTEWSHSGISESAGLLGAPSPAIANRVAVVGYSSGELFGLRLENGNVAWNETLAAIKRVGLLANLADIRAIPVVANDTVYALSHSGRMVALDVNNGLRKWQRPIGGVNTPVVSGDFIFVLNNENELLALSREDGRVRWASALPRYENPEKHKDPIVWAGPVMAEGKLYLAGSTGQMLVIDIAEGTIEQQVDLPGSVSIPPLVAAGTLYILTDDADLVAYQ